MPTQRVGIAVGVSALIAVIIALAVLDSKVSFIVFNINYMVSSRYGGRRFQLRRTDV
jgi:hypothetical protein